jgi:hypothetical protein
MKHKIAFVVAECVVIVATFYAGMKVQELRHPNAPIGVASHSRQDSPKSQPDVISIAVTTPAPNSLTSNLPTRTAISKTDMAALLQDSSTAAAYVNGITDDLNFRDLAVAVAKKWAASDPQGALTWAKGLPAGDVQNAALKMVFNVYGQSDPQGALALAQTLPDDDPNGLRLQAEGEAATHLDPAAGAAFLSSLNWTESRLSGSNPTAVVTARWLAADPQAASQWVTTLPTGNTRDSAILSIVSVAGDSDPSTAFNWLRTMSNVGTRGTTTNAFIAQWASKDPDAATAAVMQAYPNNNNGRQAALLSIIQQSTPKSSANPP